MFKKDKERIEAMKKHQWEKAGKELGEIRRAYGDCYCPVNRDKCILEQCVFWRERIIEGNFVEPFAAVIAGCRLERGGL